MSIINDESPVSPVLGARQIPRCCGERREPGGVYVESGGGTLLPFELLLCPPKRIGHNNILPAIGMKVFQIGETSHVADMIGMDSYPYPAMWIEEVNIGGVSRRIAQSTANLLEPDSMLFVAHRRAYVHNFQQYAHRIACPKLKVEHADQRAIEDCCASFFWEDFGDDCESMKKVSFPEDQDTIRIGREFYTRDQVDERFLVQVTLPAGTFYAYRRIGFTPEYATYGAFFACFPISRLVVVDDPMEGTHVEKLRTLRNSTRMIVDHVER